MSSILAAIGSDPDIVFTVSSAPWPETPRSAKRLRSIYTTAEQAFRGAKIRSRANNGEVFSVVGSGTNLGTTECLFRSGVDQAKTLRRSGGFGPRGR